MKESRKFCRTLLALSTLTALLSGFSEVAACEGQFLPPNRQDKLGAMYSKSVFQFRGGTAYFIGGQPGFLLTAHHVVKDSASSANEICSPHYSVTSSTPTCFPVSVVDDHLVKWDLSLLRLEDPLPNSVEPIEIAAADAIQGVEYTILGYGKPKEAIARSWSTPTGKIFQRVPVDARMGSVELLNRDIYHVDATQYPGASGGPVLDVLGFAWATAVRSIDSDKTAYGIPHDTSDFIDWLLRNTSPSAHATQLIEGSSEPEIEGEAREALRARLINSMDVGGRTLSHLDLLHWTDGLLKSGKENLWHDLFVCPIAKATALFIDWDKLVLRDRSSEAIELAAEVAETAKGIALSAAIDATTEAERALYLERSGVFALRVSQHLAELTPKHDDVSDELLDFEKKFFGSAGVYFDNSDTPLKLVINARENTVHNQVLTERQLKNLQDASAAFGDAYRISRSEVSFANSILAMSLMLAIESNRPEDQRDRDFGEDARPFIGTDIVPEGFSEEYHEFIESFRRTATRDLTYIDTAAVLEPAHQILRRPGMTGVETG